MNDIRTAIGAILSQRPIEGSGTQYFHLNYLPKNTEIGSATYRAFRQDIFAELCRQLKEKKDTAAVWVESGENIYGLTRDAGFSTPESTPENLFMVDMQPGAGKEPNKAVQERVWQLGSGNHIQQASFKTDLGHKILDMYAERNESPKYRHKVSFVGDANSLQMVDGAPVEDQLGLFIKSITDNRRCAGVTIGARYSEDFIMSAFEKARKAYEKNSVNALKIPDPIIINFDSAYEVSLVDPTSSLSENTPSPVQNLPELSP